MCEVGSDSSNKTCKLCQLCCRTFKPEALERHKKGCKEDKPMAKNKGPGYTAQMKAKVNYPKLGKSSQQQQQQKMDQPQQNIPEPSVPGSPSIIRKETVVISKAKPPPAPAATTATTATTTAAAAKIRTDQPELIEEPEDVAVKGKKTSSLSRKDTIVIQRHKNDEPPTMSPIIQKQKKVESKENSLRSKSTESSSSKNPSKEDIISLVQTEDIFDSLEHRVAILELVSDYAKNVWRGQILETLNHPVFDNIDNLEEVSALLNNFVATKMNNNN